MSDHREVFNHLKIERLLSNLKKRGMNGYYCKNTDELVEKVTEMLDGAKVVSSGGSQTLKECGVKDLLATKPDIEFLDRDNRENLEKINRESFSADVYFMSTNAISEDGILVNIDGVGNRVAALCYGPKKVVVIAGANKITSTLDEAILRARTIAAPTNCIRLDMNTPCKQTGVCANCLSPDSICSQFVVTRKSMDPDRIHIILVDSSYGY